MSDLRVITAIYDGDREIYRNEAVVGYSVSPPPSLPDFSMPSKSTEQAIDKFAQVNANEPVRKKKRVVSPEGRKRIAEAARRRRAREKAINQHVT